MNLLSIEKVGKNFGGLRALHTISLQINSGEIVAIIGPNGAGKTTLFNVLTGFIRQDSGQIYFQGQSVSGPETPPDMPSGDGPDFSNRQTLSGVDGFG